MSQNATSFDFDVVFIGGGPGGYTGAIRAAQLGLKTAVIEKRPTLGGTCLNVGCIPSKALLDSSEHFVMARKGDFAVHGLKFGNLELDLSAMLSRKDKIVKELTQGVAFLMRKNKIKVIAGAAKLTSANEIQITSAGGESSKVSTKNIVIATGSAPIELPFARFDGSTLLSSTEALSLPEVPKHLVVIGGGVIGLELGSVWLRLGAKVTVIEAAPMICGATDFQIAQSLLKVLQKQGMEFRLGTKVEAVTKDGHSAAVVVRAADGSREEIQCDKVLVAVGRKPYTEGLGLEDVGVRKDERGFIEVDGHLRSSVPGVFAIGDVVRGPMLAHKAEEEGVAVAEQIAGRAGHVNYNTIPGVIYTWPEVASVGYTEEQLKASGTEYRVGTFPFAANGRAKALGSTDGIVKILADKASDKVLGVHILGPRASDMIAEAVVAMEFGASSEDIARSFHGHPTLSEVMREAALAVDGRARQS